MGEGALEQPLVSVLMTAFNREKYIAEAIESVLASSYTHFELIIVDDGSSDATVSIAHKFAQADSRVFVYVNEHNLGDYPNRNKAAFYAQGKYLKYVDADDLIYPWGLEHLVEMMEMFPDAAYGLCSTPQDESKIFPYQLTSEEAYRTNYFGNGIFSRSPLSSIIRKDIFDLLGGFKPLRMVGDYEMWHRLSLNYAVVLMPEGMIWYRKHAEQEMKSYASFGKVYAQIAMKYIGDPKCALLESEKQSILKTLNRNISKQLVKELIQGKVSGFLNSKKEFSLSITSILRNLFL